MDNVILLNKLSEKLSNLFCLFCGSHKRVDLFRIRKYLEYESQIQQKSNNVGAEKNKGFTCLTILKK